MGNYVQKNLTKNLSPIIYHSGIHNLTKPFFGGRGHILMMHRVIPLTNKSRIHNHLSLEISPEHLERIIDFFLKLGYDFISLDTLSDWIGNNIRTKRKFVVFTFDDGYKDNIEFAYPILSKHKVPFTIYVTNSFLDNKAILWWYLLEDLVLKVSNISYVFPSGGIDVKCYSFSQKEKAFNVIRTHIMKLTNENLENELNKFFSSYGFQISDYAPKLCMNWESLTALVTDSLFSIGSHTLNHYNLCNLSGEQAYTEIYESKKIIEDRSRNKVKHFSYPLGKFGEREVEIARRSGFMTATTTQTGNIHRKHSDNLLSLPRIQINSLTTEKVLKLQINGFFPALRKIIPDD